MNRIRMNCQDQVATYFTAPTRASGMYEPVTVFWTYLNASEFSASGGKYCGSS